ncbi:DUF4012 domain-containing protein [Actinoplanes sp. NEAU-A12]|uniref:DUF4012 domain-containing protein n=1 Tax=Actinoplanes sandaracinus TaxID=3045177 RepID=A0ABT6WNL6_9ACTN|nr:DUF4012 domain-containing protein [Actinoplanes sandaracinus]MDI6101290.1 DUF4012 domain-containing protein [Actinoplanes sandaracinus]
MDTTSAPTDAVEPERGPRATGRRSRRLPLVAGLLAVVVTGSAVTTWSALRVRDTHDHLRAAAGLIQRLQQQLQTADPAAGGTLGRLQEETRAARAGVDGLAWRLGGRLPVAGDDLIAVRAVTTTLDALAHDGLPQLVSTASLLAGEVLGPGRGRLNLEPMKRAAPELARAGRAFQRARQAVDAIADTGLTDPVREAVLRLRAEMGSASGMITAAARAATLLPAMLGDGGSRTYLVLFQNLAEVRATGGMPGAFVVLEADRGRIDIADQGTATGLQPFPRPVLPLTPSDRQLYTDKLATFPADINLTPHFPTTARLAREMYRRRTGQTVDGVFATDPVALSYLLRALGPVPVAGGRPLTADSAVPLLLSRIYADGISPVEQDAYFAAAARATFRALLRRPLDPAALKSVLAQAAAERRLLVWSTRPEENRLLENSTLAGVLPASDGDRPTVGVFLNDGSGAKLGYYLTHRAELAVTPTCRSDGRRELTLTVTLGSTAPAKGLPAYVLGLGLAGDPYTTRTNVSVYTSTGGALVSMRLDGAAQAFGSGRDRRRAVGIVTVDVPPGKTRTLRATMLTGVPAGGYAGKVTPRLWLTPGIAPWTQLTESGDRCPASR